MSNLFFYTNRSLFDLIIFYFTYFKTKKIILLVIFLKRDGILLETEGVSTNTSSSLVRVLING